MQNRPDRPRRSASVSRPRHSGRQDDLDHDGIEVGDGGLDQVESERGYLGVLAVGPGEVAGLAVEMSLLAEFQFSTTCRPSWISLRSSG